MSKKPFILSKSNAMMAFTCMKTLWLSKNKEEEKAPVSESLKLIFEQGNEVGKLAHKLFSNGEEILTENYDREQVVKDTQERMKQKWNVLFEAGFIHNGAYCRCDVIEQNKDGSINLYEVKSSTKPKEKHFIDLSYQAYILRNLGYKIKDIRLIHIRGEDTEKDEHYNKNGVYYFNGKEIEVEKFFKNISVKEETKAFENILTQQTNISIDDFWNEFLEDCKKVENKNKEPEISIGKQCVKDGVECPWYSSCHSHIKKDDIFHLKLSQKKKELLAKSLGEDETLIDYISMKEIPNDIVVGTKEHNKIVQEKIDLKELIDNTEDKEVRKELRAELKEVNASLKNSLTELQSISVRCVKNPRTNIFNEEELLNHLKELKLPLSYTDFETINPAIPLFKNTHSFQVLPFQYILYTQEKSGVKRTDYLYNNKDVDPREEFIINLLKDIPKTGSVIVYNKSFEDARLKELGEAYPDYEEQLNNIRERLWDLRIPFQKRWFTHIDLETKNSIKRVLTILAPNFSYHDINIQKGDEASALFLKFLFDETLTQEEKDKLEQDLKDYCGLDGLAMIKILEKLCEVVGFKLG